MYSLGLIITSQVIKKKKKEKKKKKKRRYVHFSFTLCAYLTKNEEFFLFIYEQSFASNF